MPRYFSAIKSSRRQLFGLAKTPFVAHAFVKIFGKRLRQTVRNGLGHDGVVVVVLRLEALDHFFQSNARRDGERAEIIIQVLAVGWLAVGGFGAMKSARHQFGVPSPLSICWRRKWNVVRRCWREPLV